MPLLNALNIKINMKADEKADLLLENDLPDIEMIAKRIEKLAIFENVYIFENKPINGIKKYLKRQSNISFVQSVKNSTKELKYNVISKFSKSYMFEKKILNNMKMNLGNYDKVYLCSFSKFVLNAINIMNKENLNEINIFEGSLGDYIRNVAKNFYKYKKNINFYLYDKDLVVWEACNENLLNIIKFDKNNKDFVEKINYIFNVPENLDVISNKIIFFDQVSEPMPSYLKHINIFFKIFLHNALKKHIREDLFYKEKSRIFHDLIDIFHEIDKDVKIKLHPRTKLGIPKDYLNFDFIGGIRNDNNIPWEIYLLNNKVNNCLFFTMFSTSVVSEFYSFSSVSNNKVFIVYNLYDNLSKFIDVKEELKKFFVIINKRYRNIYLVNNRADIKNICE